MEGTERVELRFVCLLGLVWCNKIMNDNVHYMYLLTIVINQSISLQTRGKVKINSHVMLYR